MPIDLLDTEDRDNLKAMRERLADLEEPITRASEAGIDVTSLRQRKHDTERRISQMLNAFFPGE